MTDARTEARLLAIGADFAGRYRIEGLIGEGSTGAVYRALEVAQGRLVALKVIAPELVHDESALSRFQREIDLVQRLSHPNVVRVYDAGRTPDGVAYMVLELVRGQPLGELVRAAGPLPVDRVRRIASQILKGLMAAHAVGIVHRDIKPSSIRVGQAAGEPDFVTIVGFGIAKTAEQDATGSLTRTGVVLGGHGYMAPEQLRGGRSEPATDLYAVGVVLAEMLAGRPVHAHDTPVQTLVSPGSHARLPPEALASPLGPVLDRATQQDPSKRYASAAEMLAAIDAAVAPVHLHHSPGQAALLPQPPTAAVPFVLPYQPYIHPRHEPPPQRSTGCAVWAWILAGVGGLACLAIVAAAALYLFLRKAPDAPDAPEPQPAEPTPVVAPSAPPSPSDTAPARDAGAAPSGPPPFNRAAADSAVRAAAASAAQSCNRFGAPFGPGEAFVAFLPSGAAKGTPTANHPNNQIRTCMESALRSTRVAPFTPGGADPLGRASFNVPATQPPFPAPR